MRHILDQDEQSIIDFYDAFENNEEDSSTYCLTVTTRSGKVTDDASIKEVNEEPKVESSAPLLKLPIPPPSFPQWMKKTHKYERMVKYLDMLKKVMLSILFIEDFNEMPGFSKYLKELLTKK
ncbi:hypothetical protein HAX54_022201 [Datura stramonium]|uniref:Uncharacterized protein n=1 Tax=Datura stramonium TaxID=4076 RepID=A0ABS8UU10_DATST|nr:hypothetical protein [Datura stramonium]